MSPNPMFHPNRRHYIKGFADAAQLAGEIKRCTWTLCSGFRWSTILLLNDALSEDGCAEYAVIKLDSHFALPSGITGREFEALSLVPPPRLHGYMIESLTIDWIEHERLVEMLRRYEAEGSGLQFGEYNQHPHPEGVCNACA